MQKMMQIQIRAAYWNNKTITLHNFKIIMDKMNKPTIKEELMHSKFLRQALRLAQSGLGRTGENPAVGCVIVKNGQIIATARTGDGGRPHAESLALAQAGENAAEASVYVSLEPCAHQGKTPACAQSLINAKVAKVIFALSDPNPLVNGKGASMLQQAGIEVISPLLSEEAYPTPQGFFRRMQENLPEINIKIASSLDGRIATGTGESNWITGELARRHVHLLRSQHDAILTGIGTVLADDPMLNCRLDGLPSPVRVILDSQLRTPLNSQIAQTAKTYPTIIFSLSTDKHKHAELENLGIEIITLTSLELKEIAHQLAKRGINRLLIEGGSQITSSAINANIAQQIYWYRAPLLMGADGLPVFMGDANLPLAKRARWKIQAKLSLGEDCLEIYDTNHNLHNINNQENIE